MNSNEEELSCTYIDETIAPKKAIADLYERKKLDSSLRCRGQVVLATCQRFEIYAAGTSLSHDVSMLPGDLLSATVHGETATLIRLSEIAAGLRSQILGEQFVYGQVQAAFSDAALAPKLKWLADRALDIAHTARLSCGVQAAAEYDDIALSLLSRSRSLGTVARATLVVLGSGMLARAIVSHPDAEAYGEVKLISRSVRSVRRQIPQRVAAINAEQAVPSLLDRDVDVVIATANVSSGYRERILILLEALKPRMIVDLCAATIDIPDRRHSQYMSMYDPAFCDMVRQINERSTTSIRQATDYIREAADLPWQARQRPSISGRKSI